MAVETSIQIDLLRIQGSLVTLELVVFAPAIPTAPLALFSRKGGWVIRLVLHP